MQAPELDGAADPDAGGERRDHEAVAAEGELSAQIEGTGRQRGVVAALGVERHPVAEAARQIPRPGPGGEHAGLDGERRAVGQRQAHALARGRDVPHLASREHGALRHHVGVERQGETVRIVDRHPVGREGAGDEPGRQAGLQLGEAGAADMLEGDALPLPRRPAGRRCGEFRLALVEFEVAVAAQPPGEAGRLHHRGHGLGGEPHQAGLDLRRVPVPVGQAGAPEAHEPGRDPRQVGRRQRQGPEGVEHPARRLAQDAR